MQDRFNEDVEEMVAEAQAEIEVILMDVPVLQRTTEALGAELLAECQQGVDHSEHFGVPHPHVARTAKMRASRGFQTKGNHPKYVPE